MSDETQDTQAPDPRDWIGVLFHMISSRQYPTPAQVEDVIKASGDKTVHAFHLHQLGMAGLTNVVMPLLDKYGVKVIGDGNNYR